MAATDVCDTLARRVTHTCVIGDHSYALAQTCRPDDDYSPVFVPTTLEWRPDGDDITWTVHTFDPATHRPLALIRTGRLPATTVARHITEIGAYPVLLRMRQGRL